VHVWRDNAVLDGQRGFQQSREASCTLGVANNGLDTADIELLLVLGGAGLSIRTGEEGRCDCFGFDWVSDLGSGSVSLEELRTLRWILEI
jgi:hypothetical protein